MLTKLKDTKASNGTHVNLLQFIAKHFEANPQQSPSCNMHRALCCRRRTTHIRAANSQHASSIVQHDPHSSASYDLQHVQWHPLQATAPDTLSFVDEWAADLEPASRATDFVGGKHRAARGCRAGLHLHRGTLAHICAGPDPTGPVAFVSP